MKNQSHALTICIITKGRPNKLCRCLESIEKQQILPKEVLVIDNDLEESAKATCQDFSQRLSLRYLKESIPGAPYARNAALKNCQTPLIGFIDDDCVLDADWTTEGEQAINDKNAVFVIGHSLLFNERSLVAQAQYQTYYEWFFLSINKATQEIAPGCLDTKNVILRKSFLDKERICFDTRFSLGPVPAGEDVDLGLQLYEKGLKGYYAENMRLWHEEAESFPIFMKRAYQRGRVSFLLAQKWNPRGQLMKLAKIKPYYWIFVPVMLPIGFNRIQAKGFFKKLIILFLVKLYLKAYLVGFLKEQNIAIKHKEKEIN